MVYSTIVEVSPNTLEGSFTKDLIFSKFWLCDKLSNVLRITTKDEPQVVFVLGSWYGNMGLILPLYPIPISKLVLVDTDRDCINKSRFILKNLPFEVETRLQDAADVEYGNGPCVVINTSCNDMGDGRPWYPRIPTGSIVALQSRDDHESLPHMVWKYPMSNTFFLGSKHLTDPTESYHRLMRIGMK
jgi:hypothetical protein